MCGWGMKGVNRHEGCVNGARRGCEWGKIVSKGIM